MYYRDATKEELEEVERVRVAYRRMWGKLANVPERRFDGSREDIDALDFIDYEAGHHPDGLRGAAIILGGVLVATGALSWAIGLNGDLVLVADPVYPRVLINICPRVEEINGSSHPQDGKYECILEEIILVLHHRGLDMEACENLRKLIDSRSSSFLGFAADNARSLIWGPNKRR
jgi:hypothetical protein